MIRFDESLPYRPRRVLIAGVSGAGKTEHIVRWAWSTRNNLKNLVPAVEADFPQLTVVRLQSQREVDSWVARLV